METQKQYDLAVVGGGLAGLSLAILQAKAGKRVVLFEKNKYPFHRVCGEYISLESWDFLNYLGLNLEQLNLPIIKKLQVSSPKGTVLSAPLTLGGFGVSRYSLDQKLVEIARKLGVDIQEGTTVKQIEETSSGFEIAADALHISAKMAVGAFGKRSNLDVNWKREFINKNRTSLNQFVGVKYHIDFDFAKNTIALHNFKDGYCGISAIEGDKYCLCYMTTKKNLKLAGNSIEQLETQILSKNPYLKNIFQNATKLWDAPEVISQISFEKKLAFYQHIPLAGDASGMIAPLCGNGMSMAFHGALLLNESLLSGQSLDDYQLKWNKQFAVRLRAGRIVQRLFGNEITTDLLVRSLRYFPSLTQKIIGLTHGSIIKV